MNWNRSTMSRLPCWGEVSKIDSDVISKITKLLEKRVKELLTEAKVPIPERVIVAAGEQALDCNGLYISFTGLREGLPNADAPPDPCYAPLLATFTITIARCIPVPDNRGTPPSAEKVAAAAAQTMQDAYVLQKGSCGLDMYGALEHEEDSRVPLGGMGVETELIVGDPQGGMQTVTLNLTFVLG